MAFAERVQHAWNAFMNKDPTPKQYSAFNEISSYSRPDRIRFSRGNERSIITAVYTRLAIDASSIKIEHVRLDSNNQYMSTIDSGLNNCLTLEANIDQTGRDLIKDAVLTMLDEGCAVIAPTNATSDPEVSGSYDINELRVGKVIQWHPKEIQVRLYNETTGKNQDIWVSKSIAAIIENPFYSIMNEPNSTLQRLIRQLNLLDVIDEQSGAGKLDLMIQLPYVIKTEARRQIAETRRKEIEMQLSNSKYGIAYTDGTERVTQLNRPVDNNIMAHVESLTSMLYSQLGITTGIMDGTADENTMNNYYTRDIEPILSAIVGEMKRKFLTKTAITQKQSIEFFRDPFKLVSVSSLPDIADTFTRNEIMSSNEFRQIIGKKPSSDPKADQLVNSNISQPEQDPNQAQPEEDSEVNQNGGEEPMSNEEYLKNVKTLDDFDSNLDDLENQLGEKTLQHYASEYYDPIKAHEYYIKTRQLSERTSTKNLNEKGKEAAKYIKEQITNEKNSKIDVSKNATKDAISKAQQDTNSQIDSNRNSVNSQIESERNSTNSKIEDESKSIKTKIQAHANKMASQITTLSSKLKNMTASQKAASRELIQKQIDKLRADNSAARLDLQSSLNKTRNGLRSDLRGKQNSLRSGLRDTSTGLRNGVKETNSGLRTTLKGNKDTLRDQHKKNKEQYKSEADSKYQLELGKLKSTKGFTTLSRKGKRKK